MRNVRTLFALLLLAIVAVAGALMFFFESAPQQLDVQPGAQPRENAILQDEASGQPDVPKAEMPRPTFDVVRVEKDGSVVMAGQAEAGATVIVRSGTLEIGRAIADENGEWILQQDKTLPRSEHGIELSAQSPKSTRTLFSKQRLAISLSDPKQGEPLVALTEEGKPTRVLQMPTQEMLNELAEAKAEQRASVASVDDLPETTVVTAEPGSVDSASSSPPLKAGVQAETVVGFTSVDYEDTGQKSMVFISGIGTPGSRVAIYIDNVFAGLTVTDASGSWSFTDNQQLGAGTHILRADVIDKATSSVVARAEVNFEREQVSDSRTALLQPGAKNTEELSGNTITADTGGGVETAPKVIVVKKGDTLWHIAEQFYGDGARYTQIFQNNRNQIRNPHRIYPDQRFVLPNDKPELTR